MSSCWLQHASISKKINWNGIFKKFLLDEWLELKPFSCAFLCICYLAQPGGLEVKIMSGGDEGMWAGNNISLWNNPSVAVLSQRPLFMEILQMWSPFQRWGKPTMQVDIPLKDIQALKVMEKPQSATLYLLHCCKAQEQPSDMGLGTFLALSFWHQGFLCSNWIGGRN